MKAAAALCCVAALLAVATAKVYYEEKFNDGAGSNPASPRTPSGMGGYQCQCSVAIRPALHFWITHAPAPVLFSLCCRQVVGQMGHL